MKKSILTGFGNLSDADLAKQAQSSDAGMTDNPNFPELSADVAVLHTATLAFTTALAATMHGSGQSTAVKNTARKAVIRALRVVGVRVNLAADGNLELLETTGFPIGGDNAGGRKKKAGPEVTPGHNFLLFSFKRINGATAHVVRYTQCPVSDDSVWTEAHTTDTSFRLSGLASGSQYAFCVAGIGKDPELVFTDPVASFVL